MTEDCYSIKTVCMLWILLTQSVSDCSDRFQFRGIFLHGRVTPLCGDSALKWAAVKKECVSLMKKCCYPMPFYKPILCCCFLVYDLCLHCINDKVRKSFWFIVDCAAIKCQPPWLSSNVRSVKHLQFIDWPLEAGCTHKSNNKIPRSCTKEQTLLVKFNRHAAAFIDL